MKKIWKDNAKLILIVTIAVVLASGATYAATTMYDSNAVSYDNTASGLRSTNVQSALDELYGNVAQVIINIKDKVDELYEIKDIASGESTAGLHNAIFRGKDVSSYMPSSIVSGGDGSIYDRIAGTNGYRMFQDLYVGDYIVANGVTWRIAGFDINYSDSAHRLATHHAVIVPDEVLGTSYMKNDGTTNGGYVGSDMYITTLPSVKATYIDPVFSGHLLMYDSYLSDRINASATNNHFGGRQNGVSDSGSWYNRYIDLMNEVQITGNVAISSSFYDTGSDNIQFPLFRLRPEYKIAYNSIIHSSDKEKPYWLRSIANATNFALLYYGGVISGDLTSHSYGVRPYFYIG